ncbi:dihydrofolate reductase family protein [Neobacillus sp. PS3-12]|uniref:dihydrofolate reductase family protein n=1 Tax=Neobacillus sp. PS3-12 TaxID=3070677 RepID=UPI0027E1B920|nr:dihydrofolate reductase family protein [Neobacillus sp. PS3-12]WML53366.1 dihydrofolate reductase family protein [Neobacillus sp. PS3-12]
MEQYDADQGQYRRGNKGTQRAARQNLVIFGSPGAAKTLLKLGLIDEFQLTICPVVLGGGKSVFDGGEKIRLKLLSSRTLKSGIIAARYELEK